MKFIKISVVTACYNMEKYIDRTIRSVLNQNYPNLEYIIVDGGSTDGTLEIVNKYKQSITHVISEKDDGMYDAIHKGFLLASGEVICWLNGDDQYMPWTFDVVNNIFSTYPDINWICGQSSFCNEQGSLTRVFTHPGSKPRDYIRNGWFRDGVMGYLQQENMFWKRELYYKAGGLNRNFQYAGDFDLWTRMAEHSELVTVAIPLAMFMRRSNSLSMGSRDKYTKEVNLIISNRKKFPSYIWNLFSFSMIFTRILRQFTFRKSYMIVYQFVNNKICYINVNRSVSNNSLSELFLEYNCKIF